MAINNIAQNFSFDELLESFQDQENSSTNITGNSSLMCLPDEKKSDSMEDLIRMTSPNNEDNLGSQSGVTGSQYPYNQSNQGQSHYSNDMNNHVVYNLNPNVDYLQMAYELANITTGLPSNQPTHDTQLKESINFVTMPNPVQFRYLTEINKKATSPIKDKNGGKVEIQVTNLQPNFNYKVVITVVDAQYNPSIHKLYKTKENPIEIPSYDQDIPPNVSSYQFKLENVGILRRINTREENSSGPKSRKTKEKDSQDSVWLLASLYAYQNDVIYQTCICQCISDEIYDSKRMTLKIQHINPTVAIESGNQEMTLLCSNVKDIEVHFKVGPTVYKVKNFIHKHRGVALVLLIPACDLSMMMESIVEAEVTLFCPNTERRSSPVIFKYKIDPFRSPISRRMRDRSPLRGQLETDSSVDDTALRSTRPSLLADEMKKLSIQAPATTAVNHTRRSTSPMAELTLVRDVANGDRELNSDIKTVIRRSPYILHVPDASGLTPPMRAVIRGDEDLLNEFLHPGTVDEDCMRQIMNSRTPQGVTLLHLTAIAEHGTARMFDRLLSNDVDPRITDSSGQTVIHRLVENKRNSLLESVIPSIRLYFRKKDRKSVSSEMSNLLNCIDNDGRSAIHIAVLSGNIQAIDTLVNEGVDINFQSRNGFTVLHWAVLVNDEVAVQKLLDSGVAVHVKNKWGVTALRLAEDNVTIDPRIKEMLNNASSRRCSGESDSP